MKVAIVGGGISGFSLAYFLRQRLPNLKMDLFEKSSAFGGRMATRRINNQVPIDTGCQYLSIDQAELRDFFFRTVPQGELREIPLPILCLPDGWVVDTQDRYYFKSGMTTWSKALAKDLERTDALKVHFDHSIENLLELREHYDHIFVTVPSPQAKKLGATQEVEYASSMSVVFNWHQTPTDVLSHYGYRDLSGRDGVTWLAHEGLKREKPGLWVAQMAPHKSIELSRQTDQKDLIEDLLQLDLIEWMPIMSEGEKTVLEVKYWKNAFPVSLVDPSEQIGFEYSEHKNNNFTYFTGDAYLGVGRVENALQACLRTADDFIKRIS